MRPGMARTDIVANNRNGLSKTYNVSNLSFGLDMPDGLECHVAN